MLEVERDHHLPTDTHGVRDRVKGRAAEIGRTRRLRPDSTDLSWAVSMHTQSYRNLVRFSGYRNVVDGVCRTSQSEPVLGLYSLPSSAYRSR